MGNRITDTSKDLLQRQRWTWENILNNLREKILKQIRITLLDQITQNHGPEEEITIGYEDEHEVMQAELNTIEAGQNPNSRTVRESWTTKVATGKVGVFNRAPAKGVSSESGLVEEIADSHEHWYIAEEGEVDGNCNFRTAGGLTADGEEGDWSCVVEGY